jgi:predicted PurR-regulated permease PerM
MNVDWMRIGWIAVGALLAVALLFVLYSFIGTFVFGVFIYYATRPVYRRLERHIYPRSLAAVVSILLLALPALLLFAYLVAVGLQQFGAVTQNIDLGPFRAALEPYIDVSRIVNDPRAALQQVDLRQLSEFDISALAPLQTVIGVIGGYIGLIAGMLLHLFVMLALAFYLLRDGPRASRWLLRQFSDDQGILETYLRAVDNDFASIFFGNILNAIMTGLIGAVSYSAMNRIAPSASIPYPELLGLVTGVASLIPVVGMKLVYFPITLYLLVQQLTQSGALWFVLLFFVVSLIIVDTLPDLVLRPYVSGRNLHVGTVMFAYIFGPLLFGWYGIFLGPILLVFAYHFVRIVLPELLSDESASSTSDPVVRFPSSDALVDHPSTESDGRWASSETRNASKRESSEE